MTWPASSSSGPVTAARPGRRDPAAAGGRGATQDGQAGRRPRGAGPACSAAARWGVSRRRAVVKASHWRPRPSRAWGLACSRKAARAGSIRRMSLPTAARAALTACYHSGLPAGYRWLSASASRRSARSASLLHLAGPGGRAEDRRAADLLRGVGVHAEQAGERSPHRGQDPVRPGGLAIAGRGGGRCPPARRTAGRSGRARRWPAR
jgi:hypothetical protein